MKNDSLAVTVLLTTALIGCTSSGTWQRVDNQPIENKSIAKAFKECDYHAALTNSKNLTLMTIDKREVGNHTDSVLGNFEIRTKTQFIKTLDREDYYIKSKMLNTNAGKALRDAYACMNKKGYERVKKENDA